MNRSRYDFPVHRRVGASVASEPIAIVGASCRLPGAPNLDALWPMLLSGTDAVGEIPDSRWNKADLFHPERGQRGKAYTFAAGVLTGDVSRFDAGFFGISPREATQMDPQQRLLLELAYEAVEDGGFDLDRLAGEAVGVFVGGSSWDYLNLNIGDPASTDAYSMIGVTLCSLANRISYAFDLRGPSFTVDTACSSSLVALHQACEALRHGQVEMALVGGVSLLLAPQSFVGFCAASMLSPTGRCHAFDARADGYVRAEGGGVVLLKPLGAALAAGDTVRGVIRGTGINSDGRTTGLSLPNRDAQAALLRDVYEGFGIDPDRLAYVEAHGTGTPAGDPIEAGALGEMLGQRRARPLPIGSIKTNIGHLEAGSGMAGLLKAMLVAERRIIPPSLHCETPNPHIPFADLNLALSPAPSELDQSGEPALVGVNSFGFGGTNAHAVIEGPDPRPASKPVLDRGGDLPPLLLSARSEEALRVLAGNWRDILRDGSEPDLPALVRGTAMRRTQHGRRLVVPSGPVETVRTALDAFVRGTPTSALATGSAATGGIAFAFSGNGSQWAGMAADAVAGSAAFRAGLADIDEALQRWLGWSVVEALGTADAEALRNTAMAQPLLFAVQAATVLALREHGVEPVLCLGHSVGEIAAAWACGALDLDEAARVIAARSRAQQKQHGVGGMAVIGLGAEAAAKALAAPEIADVGLELAAHNSAGAATVAGSIDSLDRLAEAAAMHGWRYTRLDLDYAFHSAAMDPIRSTLVDDLAGLAPGHSRLPFLSTVTGTVLDGHALDAGYWWRNVREPVLFAEAARAAVARGARILVEIGPHPVVQAYLADALRIEEKDGRVVTSLSRRAHRGDPIAALAARIHAAGGDVRDGDAFVGPATVRGLPAYPWQRERFWVERTDEAFDRGVLPFEHPLLGNRDDGDALLWSRHLGVEVMPWLADHAVGGAAVAPAAALLDTAFAAARARYPEASTLELLDVEIGRALVFEPHMLRDLRFRIGSSAGDFELASRPRLSGEAWTIHMTGRIVAAEAATPAAPPLDERPLVRQVRGPALYALASGMGLDYGPHFQVVDRIDVRSDTEAEVAFAAEPLDGAFLLSPNLVDGALQGLLALAADRLGSDAGVLPWRFGRVRLYRMGSVPASARLTITRVGPRSVRADILLLDGEGRPLAELAECWFVRVALGRKPRADEMFFHPALVGDAGPITALPRAATAPAALLAEAGDGRSHEADSRLLVDAFVTAAAMEALKPLVGAEHGRLVPQDLLRDDGVAASSRALLDRLLRWLAADGVATQGDDGTWTFAADLPPADAILRTLFYDLPCGVADAALMALAAESLPQVLRDGAEAAPALPAALWDQFLLDSPASAEAADALAGAAHRMARSDAPIRILEVGARRGGFTRRLLRLIEPDRASLVAATSAGDLPSLRAAIAHAPGARAVAWSPGEVMDDGPFDLVIGLYPFALEGWAGAELAQVAGLLRAGGTLLLAEPAPNRLWQLIRPDAPPPTDTRRLVSLCQANGFSDPQTRPLGTDLWPVYLIAAVAPETSEREARPAFASLSLFADEVDPALAERLGAAVSLHTHPLALLGDAEAIEGLQGHAAIVLAAAGERCLADCLALIAGLAGRASEAPLTVTLAIAATAIADVDSAALMGVRRVFANEAAAVTLRLVRVDPALDPAAAIEAMAREILYPDAEDEIAWGPSGRSVQRVRRGLPRLSGRTADALRLVVERPGLLDSLTWTPLAPGEPGSGEIAIKVAAAGLNFRDVMWSMGLLPDEALLDGFAGPTLGLECAGTVTAIGPDVTGFTPGDRVMAFTPAALATHGVTKAHAAMHVPDGMSFTAAATVPVAFLTVAYALGHLARIGEGETVLVHGGAGGVGLAAIQYARARGARVFATAGSPAKRALLRSLDVAAVLDSRSLAFADEVMALTGGEGVDVVLNSLAGEAMRRSLGLVKPFGRFLELGKRDFYENNTVGLRPFRHNVSYFGIDADQLPVRRPALAASLFAELGAMFAAGTLRPLPYRQFDFADVEDAFRLMQASGHIGKIVLAPGAALPVAAPAPAPVEARANRAYIVTGGLDGFGRETARWLARQGAGHLALLGRRGPATPGADALIAEFAEAGVDARAYAVDVADETALATVLDAIRADQAPIGGVVHAAVAMDDGLLKQLDADRFARALRPKLGGAEALDRLTRIDPIDLFLLFSSVTTPLGNPGQGNYVAANAAMEALAERRHAEGRPALAVQWGPIGDAGYLVRETQVSELLQRQLGGNHLTAAEALDTLPALLAAGIPVAGMATVRWGALRGRLPLLASSLFAEMDGERADEAGDIDLRALLLECSPEEARERVTAMLVEEVARIMKLAAERIEAARPLAELGMDSLMAVELRLAVEQRFGITVPLLALSEGATLSAMAGRIVREIGDPEVPPQGDDGQIAARMAKLEGTMPGPADHIEGPAEPGFAAAAATSP